jgi:hypothetical protein
LKVQKRNVMNPLKPVDERLLACLEYAPACFIEALVKAYPDPPRADAHSEENGEDGTLRVPRDATADHATFEEGGGHA